MYLRYFKRKGDRYLLRNGSLSHYLIFLLLLVMGVLCVAVSKGDMLIITLSTLIVAVGVGVMFVARKPTLAIDVSERLVHFAGLGEKRGVSFSFDEFRGFDLQPIHTFHKVVANTHFLYILFDRNSEQHKLLVRSYGISAKKSKLLIEEVEHILALV